ncbi:MAG: SNF2 helicase associated domain-containing protein [Firmicutes bacterium]|nr:SNF2 helicase associated domain-containing protein [Bacillota bacterium]
MFAKLQELAGETVFNQATEYYRKQGIINYDLSCKWKEYRLRAIVKGNGPPCGVDVTLKTGKDRLECNCFCTCSTQGVCKHATAVIYKFLAEDFPRLELIPAPKPPAPEVVEEIALLRQAALDSGEKVILNYEVKGLAEPGSLNFKITLGAGSDLETSTYLVHLLELLGNPNTSGSKRAKLLNRLSGFDRLVIEYLENNFTKKEVKNRAVEIPKSKANLGLILAILENRPVSLSPSKKPLILGERIKPEVIVSGDETRLRFQWHPPEGNSCSVFHRGLDCFLVDNILHLLDMEILEKIPKEISIPPEQLGEVLFEILPSLRKKLDLKLPPELAKQQLTSLEPEISLDFDYEEDRLVCRPQIRIPGAQGREEQVFQGGECLEIIRTLEPRYQREPDIPNQWTVLNLQPIWELGSFLEKYNFSVMNESLALQNQASLFQFITGYKKQLLPEWRVNVSPKLAEFRIEPVKLEPRVEVDLSSKIDWFELKIYYNIGGQTFSHQELMKMMRETAGGRYIQSGNQIYVVEESPQYDIINIQAAAASASPQGASFQDLPLLGRRQELFNLLFYRQFFRDQGIPVNGNDFYQQFERELSGQRLLETCELPPDFAGELRQYQREGFYWLRFLHKYGFSGILADDMGLGKTVQVLTLIKSLPKMKPALIVCPLSLLYNWAAEIEKFYPGTRYLIYYGPQEQRERLRLTFGAFEILITTYDILARDIADIQNQVFSYCILDEAQQIKNPQTQRAKEVKKIQANYRLAMTGTPMENRLEELWSIFDFLMPGYLGSYSQFSGQYVAPLKKAMAPEVLKRLKQKIAPFILRRRKEEVLAELPEKVVMVENVLMSQLQEDAYRTVLKQLKQDIINSVSQKGLKQSQITVLSALTKLRLLCDHPSLVMPNLGPEARSGKLDALMELIDEARSGGHRAVVFSQFVRMLKLVALQFQEAGIGYEYMDGAVRDRMARINHFNEDAEVSVFLISLKTGGAGINLTSADIVIHLDPWWNLMAENQATDRVHRMGQQKQVMVYKLITKGTVEEKILQLQDRKKFIFDSVIEDNESPVDQLTWEDIKELFEI